MENLASILANKVIAKKSNFAKDDEAAKAQLNGLRVYDELFNRDKNVNVGMLIRLAKLKPSAFLRAENKLKANQQDGVRVKNKVSLFLWLYKQK